MPKAVMGLEQLSSATMKLIITLSARLFRSQQSIRTVQDLALLSSIDKDYCHCCEVINKKELSMSTSIIGAPKKYGKIESIFHRGITYGTYDFVYVVPKELSEPYIIAQITEIRVNGLHQWLKSAPSQVKTDFTITVQVFNRYDDLFDQCLKSLSMEMVIAREIVADSIAITRGF